MIVTLPWKPHAKQRPRSGRGHTYTPTATKNAEAALVAAFRELMPDHSPIDGPILVELNMTDTEVVVDIRPTGEWANRKLRGDVDNYAKTILDALNGVAFGDDSQIRALLVRKV